MVDMLTNIHIEDVSQLQLLSLLHSSTISEDISFYADCVQVINSGDILDRLELYWVLMMNQRDPFFEMENISNKAIDKRLDEVLLNDRL